MFRTLSLLLIASAVGLMLYSNAAGAPVWLALALALAGGWLLTRKQVEPSPHDSISEIGSGTPRRRELSNLQSERLLDATMSGMREGVVVVDETMRVISSNNAARALFPRFLGSLESHRLSELTRSKTIYSAFQQAIEQGEYVESKVEMVDIDTRVFDLRVVPLRLSDESSANGAMGVFFDITQIERLERVRQEFLSNVSHELRTPLTAIMAFVETLEDGAIEDLENNQRFLSVIRRNAERMRNLIDDILDLSAIEAGNVAIEASDVHLSELVHDISVALTSKAVDRDVTILNKVAQDVTVSADRRRLEQMLTNLMDNAVKFNRRGGAVTVGFERAERDRITVTDNGEGIAPEHAKRIFERFYRIDRARSREMGGTGLGLAIVKHLARLHGGEVSVSSTIGQGSTFIIDLPVHASQSPTASIHRSEVA